MSKQKNNVISLYGKYEIDTNRVFNGSICKKWFRTVISREGILLYDFFHEDKYTTIKAAVNYFKKNKHGLESHFQRIKNGK